MSSIPGARYKAFTFRANKPANLLTNHQKSINKAKHFLSPAS